MLNRIKLTNFRKHTNTDLPLHNGLMVLRGNNEAGKSTLIEGICYALFGVKALRSPLEDAVTHGEAVNTLKAELTLVIDSVEYIIKRGKSGAEVTYDGGRVTGQNEVTNFICSKMGTDPHASAKLQLANQNEIRGALEAGPKATTELIERLAEFDQIDLLVERMQERLTLGSAAGLETKLAEAQEKLAEARAKAVAPDLAQMEAELKGHQGRQSKAQAELEALEGEVQAAQAAVDLARSAQQAFEQAQTNHTRAVQRLTKFGQDLQASKEAANSISAWPNTEDQVRQEIAALEQADKHLKVFGRLQTLLTPPFEIVDDYSFQGLQEYAKDLTNAQRLAQNAIADAGSKTYLRKSEISTGSCSWCGQDFSHLPQVAEKNTQIQADIEKLQAIEADAKAKLAQIEEDLADANEIVALSRPRIAALEANPDYVKRVGDTLPPTLQWIGPDIGSLGDPDAKLAEARRTLSQMLAAQASEQAAQARYDTLLGQRGAVDAEVDDARAKVEQAELRPDLAVAEARREVILVKRRPLQLEASDAQTAAQQAEYTIRDAKREFERAVQQVEHLEDGVTALTHQIKTLAFNNTLLKRVRQCRPLIADKLWTIVLSAVSSYFSEMRGFKSRVTKDLDGFKVDDHTVTSLSGSTLDILGLAIRVALVRTFLPNAPFMVLDEPCAAMDATRTEATLGFVLGCGFQQVLCASHDPISTSVADHVVEIGV